MKSAIDGLIKESTAAIPIYCPEMAVAKEQFEKYMAAALKPFAYKGPDIATIYFNRFAEFADKHKITVSRSRVIDLGCGHARPLALSILFYLCGAQDVLAIDLRELSDQSAIAFSAASTIISVVCGRLNFNYKNVGATWEDVKRRSMEFDLRKLLENDLAGGIPDGIALVQDKYQNLSDAERQFDILISNSVFEHLVDPVSLLKKFRESMSANGLIYAAIDYKDHRIYEQGSKHSVWQYLIDGSDGGDINYIRHSAFVQIIEDAGFEVVDCVEEKEMPSRYERERFLPEFRSLSDNDITTVAAHILLKRKRL